jgi:5'-deoxynucleotidase
MEEQYSFYALLARQKHIKRWSLMHNATEENVAEHTLMTAYLAHALALIRRDILGKPCDVEKCVMLALYHDCAEIFTGDLPTPIKYWSKAIRQAYSEVEAHSVNRLLNMLPAELRPALESDLQEPEDSSGELVHAADKLSAHIKCLEELRQGNAEFRQASEQTLHKLKEMHLPELEYFLVHFLPSFSLTLDELEISMDSSGLITE